MSNIEQLFASGLDFNHLYILQNLNNLPDINKIIGWYELLKKRDYISDDGILTEKGNFIISLFLKNQENCNNTEMLNIINKNEQIIENKQQTFSQWVAALHTKLENKIIELTGSKNVNITVNGVKYPYLCNVVDLEGKLKKAIGRYKMEDLNRIEKCLLKHCEIRNKKLLMYIYREKGDASSDLALDYDNYVEEVESKPISKKDFF
jgi:hypothetical protein